MYIAPRQPRMLQVLRGESNRISRESDRLAKLKLENSEQAVIILKCRAGKMPTVVKRNASPLFRQYLIGRFSGKQGRLFVTNVTFAWDEIYL